MAERYDIVKRAPWILLGLALAAVGLGMDMLGLDGSPGMGITQIECLALGILILLVASIPSQPSRTFVVIARLVFTLVVLAVASELVCLALDGLQSDPGYVAAEAEDAPGRPAPAPPFDYSPFVLWRVRPGFDDGTASVDGMGVRASDPAGSESEDAFQAILFGGASVWGWGVPDSCTTASYLQEGLDALLLRPVRVDNLAQPGWTVTQQLLALMLEMRAGARPDLVVFNIGLQDAAAAASGGSLHPGWLAQLGSGWNRSWAGGGPAPDPWCISSAVSRIGPVLGLRHEPDSAGIASSDGMLPVPAAPPGSAVDELVEDVKGTYDIVQALARHFGFRFAFVLRPCWPCSRRVPAPEEAGLSLPGLDSTEGAAFVREAWSGLSAGMGRSAMFIDLSGALDSVPGQVFVGADELSPLGNRLVAEEMIDALAARGLLW